jgi:predicted nucleotidyltransferase
MAYSFLTPWLPLNEANYARYQAGRLVERKRLLERILIGNILSMSKGLGYVVTEKIEISRLDVYPVRTPVRLKGVEMTGFKGTFAVNFELPDLIGLGKSVSRGFGTVRRIGQEDSMRTIEALSARERAALADLQGDVRAAFPGVSTRWTLFGSRARGDAEPDSDVDVLLELDIERLDLATKRRIRRLAGEVSLKHGFVISLLLVDRAQARERGDYAIFANIREEGIPL